jgi:hypothetical protein
MKPIEDDDEDFPYSSPDLSPGMPEPAASNAETDQLSVEDYKTVLRLIVGSAVVGNDELKQRIIIWRKNIRNTRLEGNIPISKPGQTSGDHLLYLLVGLLFQTPGYFHGGASTVNRASSRAFSAISRFFEPINNSRMMQPVRRRFDTYVKVGESIVNSLEEEGQSEVQSSRALVQQQANDELISDVLEYLVEKAKIRELIEGQSVEFAGDAVSEFRGRSADVDASLDNLVKTVLRRQKAIEPPPASQP